MDPEQRQAVAAVLEGQLKPYRDDYQRYPRLAATGRDRDEILAEMRELQEREAVKWVDGHASGAVYHGDPDHIAFQNEVYAVNSQANPLHPDLWPSAMKYEAEVCAMVAAMFHGGPGADDGDDDGDAPAPEACGLISSGGTESILLAMKAYRDHAHQTRGIERPNMVTPVTAHVAFEKACQYFGIEQRQIPVDDDMKADVAAARERIDDATVVVVGSAVQFPHGVIDPIEELAAAAAEHGAGFHTDCCLGGFVLPFAEQLGYPVPLFDYRVPGVTSISCDTHKYGYAAKGSSVVTFRHPELRAAVYYRTTEWPGGLYNSPTFAGSRAGAHSAQAWAAMVAMGEEGYLDATRRVLDAGATIRDGVAAMPDLRVLGDPLWVISFAAREAEALNMWNVLDQMGHRGWSLNGLQHPPAIHLAVTLRHTHPGVADRFLTDLAAAVKEVKADPSGGGGVMAPVYGMAGRVETKGTVEEILRIYLDTQFVV